MHQNSWIIGERDLLSNSKNAIARPLQRSSHLSSTNTDAGRLQLSVDSHKHLEIRTIGPFFLVIMWMCIWCVYSGVAWGLLEVQYPKSCERGSSSIFLSLIE